MSETGTEITLITVPESAAELLPAKQGDLNTETTGLLRAHFSEIKPYLDAIAGIKPSINGSLPFDEFGAVMEIKKMASANGYKLVAEALPATIRLAFRVAYRRLTNVPMHKLESQNRRLRLEHRKEEKAEREGSQES